MARTFSPCTPRLSHSPKPFFPCNSPLHSPIFQYTDHSMLCFFAPRNFAGAAECSVPLPTSRKKVRAPKFLRKRQRNIYPTRGQLLACARCARARAVGLNVGERGEGTSLRPAKAEQKRALQPTPTLTALYSLYMYTIQLYTIHMDTWGETGHDPCVWKHPPPTLLREHRPYGSLSAGTILSPAPPPHPGTPPPLFQQSILTSL